MSVVRWGVDGSAVYVYATSDDLKIFECCGCKSDLSVPEMRQHLMDHRSNGDCVPDWVIETFTSEAKAAAGA